VLKPMRTRDHADGWTRSRRAHGLLGSRGPVRPWVSTHPTDHRILGTVRMTPNLGSTHADARTEPSALSNFRRTAPFGRTMRPHPRPSQYACAFRGRPQVPLPAREPISGVGAPWPAPGALLRPARPTPGDVPAVDPRAWASRPAPSQVPVQPRADGRGACGEPEWRRGGHRTYRAAEGREMSYGDARHVPFSWTSYKQQEKAHRLLPYLVPTGRMCVSAPPPLSSLT
jgi:hypothetical protein